MTKKTIYSFIISLLITSNSFASEVIAQIDNYKLNNLELQVGINILNSVVKESTTDEETKKNIATKLLNDKIIEKLAKKEDLDQDPLVQIEMRSILVNTYIKKHYDVEQLAKESYNKAIDIMKNKKAYTLSHIMLKTKNEADKIFTQIKNSDKNWKKTFKKLAKEKSEDTVTAKQDGFVGTASEMKLPADFLEQIKNKPVNTPLEPFETKLGYHIVVIEKIEPTQVESYENVKNIFIANAVQGQINKIAKEQTNGKEIFFSLDKTKDDAK